MELEILYADSAVAVCRKPVGVSSEQEGAVALLQKQLGGSIFCVHRLDSVYDFDTTMSAEELKDNLSEIINLELLNSINQ
jgi:hypothetical protein